MDCAKKWFGRAEPFCCNGFVFGGLQLVLAMRAISAGFETVIWIGRRLTQMNADTSTPWQRMPVALTLHFFVLRCIVLHFVASKADLT
jgi:hypothetical protein